MRAAQTLPRTGFSRGRRRSGSPLTGLRARLDAVRIDRELAAGLPPWTSPAHAARAVRLARRSHRRGLARSLEALLEGASDPHHQHLSAVIPPCSVQVQAALAQILDLTARLRSDRPVDARGLARLRALLADGSGPCYVSTREDALRAELELVSEMLDVRD